MEPVPELVALRGEVAAVLGVRRHLDRHLLDHRQPVALEPADLLRVVRQDPDRREAEVGEDLVADPPLARVGREAELEVRLDRVEPLLLQLVGAQLVEQADPATLLGHVEQHAAVLGARSAAARARAARRSRSAASGRRRRSGTRSGRGRARRRAPSTSPLTSARWCLPVSFSRKATAVNSPYAVGSRTARRPLDELLVAAAVLDQVGDGDELQPVLARSTGSGRARGPSSRRRS